MFFFIQPNLLLH